MGWKPEAGYALLYTKGEGWEEVILDAEDVRKARSIGFREVEGSRMGLFMVGKRMVAQLAQNLTRTGTDRGVGRSRKRTKPKPRKSRAAGRRRACGAPRRGRARRVGEGICQCRQCRGWNWGAPPRITAPKFTVTRQKLDRDGYTENGSYFGVGPKLWQVESTESGDVEYVRAATLASAKAKVRAAHPGAVFGR